MPVSVPLVSDGELAALDVRAPAEFSGEQLRAARGGRISGAILWPWEENLRPEGRCATRR